MYITFTHPRRQIRDDLIPTSKAPLNARESRSRINAYHNPVLSHSIASPPYSSVTVKFRTWPSLIHVAKNMPRFVYISKSFFYKLCIFIFIKLGGSTDYVVGGLARKALSFFLNLIFFDNDLLLFLLHSKI